jgi:hypothetical protein
VGRLALLDAGRLTPLRVIITPFCTGTVQNGVMMLVDDELPGPPGVPYRTHIHVQYDELPYPERTVEDVPLPP